MVVATVTMVRVREQIDQVHVVLVYLLIILGASTAGGRLLAFPLAGAGYLLIDYYFQRPYGEFVNNKPLDWLALGSYLLTAGVATQLLARAQAEAEESRRRAIEVASLARLGSETLSVGRAEDALVRIAEAIEQQARDDETEHGVAEELEALVVVGAIAAMRESPLHQRRVGEAMADLALQCVETGIHA